MTTIARIEKDTFHHHGVREYSARFLAVDEEGNIVFGIGSTPEEAAQNAVDTCAQIGEDAPEWVVIWDQD